MSRVRLSPLRRGAGSLIGLALLLAACGSPSSATQPDPTRQPSPTADELSTLIAMQQAATAVPTATPLPSATITPTATATIVPTWTPTAPPSSPTPSAFPSYPTNTPRATQVVLQSNAPEAPAAAPDPATAVDHYYFARPFPRDPSGLIKDYLSRSYPFGSTGSGQFQTHHGVDIANNPGVDILAVADGWVYYAGSDAEEQFGPQTDFYGNVVVIEHDMSSPDGRMLYSLYGHMSQVDVQTGQRVTQGEKIAEVGSAGVALGPHLHLEVRIGDPHNYNSVYNPDLWVRPWPTFGTLAGTLTDRGGSRVHDALISIKSPGGPDRYTYSYADDAVKSDPVWGENYARGDLPEGHYKVFVRMQGVVRFQGEVDIVSGQTTWLPIVLN